MTNSIIGTIGVALLAAASLHAQTRPAKFTFDGVGLDSDFKAVAAKYKTSQPQDSYVRLSPLDVHDHISSIEVSGTGPARRVRIGFELEGPRGPVYPACTEIELRITKTYGKPNDVRRFNEEASPRADRVWTSPSETMTLICFQQPGGRAPWLAEAVTITPAR